MRNSWFFACKLRFHALDAPPLFLCPGYPNLINWHFALQYHNSFSSRHLIQFLCSSHSIVSSSLLLPQQRMIYCKFLCIRALHYFRIQMNGNELCVCVVSEWVALFSVSFSKDSKIQIAHVHFNLPSHLFPRNQHHNLVHLLSYTELEYYLWMSW